MKKLICLILCGAIMCFSACAKSNRIIPSEAFVFTLGQTVTSFYGSTMCLDSIKLKEINDEFYIFISGDIAISQEDEYGNTIIFDDENIMSTCSFSDYTVKAIKLQKDMLEFDLNNLNGYAGEIEFIFSIDVNVVNKIHSALDSDNKELSGSINLGFVKFRVKGHNTAMAMSIYEFEFNQIVFE